MSFANRYSRLEVKDAPFIQKLLNNNFKASYSDKEVKDSLQEAEYYSDDKKSFISIKFINRLDTKDPVVINNFNGDKVLVITNVVSEVPGKGKELIKFIIDKYKVDIFLTAKNKKLIEYYKNLGFKLLPTSRKNNPMIYKRK